MRSTEPEFVTYLFTKAKKLSRPLSATFELTSRCNFNCRMCYIHSDGNQELIKKELTTEQWKRIADETQKAGVLFLLITGGEPLLRDDFDEIYVYCKKLGFEISINSNASLVTDEKIALFKEYPPNKISVTVYGKDEQTYCDTTRRNGMFSVVEENIAKMKAAGIKVKMNITASNYNCADIPSLYEFAAKHDLPVDVACYLFPSARLGKDTDRPSPEKAAANMILSDKCYFGERFAPRVEAFRKASYELKGPVTEKGLHVRCRGGLASFWISYDGIMLPCGMMTTPSASVLGGIENAWQTINAETKKITLPPECKVCPMSEVCDACAASCYAETGRFDGLPVYQCRKTKEFCRLMREGE